MIRSALHQEIVVIGTVLLFEKMKERLDAILMELQRLNTLNKINDELLVLVRTVVELLEGFQQARNR
jgi:hypothetical protein